MARSTMILTTRPQAMVELVALRSGCNAGICQGLVLCQPHNFQDPDEKILEELFVDILLCCSDLQSLTLYRWIFSGFGSSSVSRLTAHGALYRLHTLHIGFYGLLDLASFFKLLSLAPALRTLRLQAVYDNSMGRLNDPHSDEQYAKPACALTNLIVSDDRGITFIHYPLLLRASATSLRRLELQWLSSTSVGRNIVQALAACTRLTTLVAVENEFAPCEIIAACPRLRRLALERPPTRREIAALATAQLQELAIVDCVGWRQHPDAVAAHWKRLRKILPRIHGLRVLRFVTQNVDTSHKAYAEARQACETRRVQLAISPRLM